MTNGAISVSGIGGGLITQPTPAFNGSTGGAIDLPVAGPVQVAPSKPFVVQNPLVDGAAPGSVFATDPQPFGVRRDTFWPRSLQAWSVLSVLLILASIQLVSPTRRWRLLRRPGRRTG